MIRFFRTLFKSKFGLAITLAFVVLIAFAFASMDITANNPTFGGIAGDNHVAVVGDSLHDLEMGRRAGASGASNRSDIHQPGVRRESASISD